MTVPRKTPSQYGQWPASAVPWHEPRRVQMLEQIAPARTPWPASTSTARTGSAPHLLSHHLKDLEAAGLSRIERVGKFRATLPRRESFQAYLARLATL